MISQRGTAESVRTACVWEVMARKVGNVHPHANFEKTSYLDFIQSSEAIAHHFLETHSVGQIVHQAVRATIERVGQNTNLGIILLLAPLTCVNKMVQLREGVKRVLSNLTVDDARSVFEAIRLARPGGLGQSDSQDVRSEPTVTLLEAMKSAADRDQVARQYAIGYKDVFEFGVPTFLSSLERFGAVEAAIVDLQLRWLAREPDTLIARKNDPAIAKLVQEKAREVMKSGGIATTEGRKAGLQLDRFLRSNGNKLNPGTTADLIAACLFAALRENRVMPSTSFRWTVHDWL